MAISERDSKSMQRLAKEGKTISKIWGDDFPGYEYWDIYSVVYAGGGRSAQGVKRAISNRLKQLSASSSEATRSAIIKEIQDMVWHLYRCLISNQQKLEALREILNK